MMYYIPSENICSSKSFECLQCYFCFNLKTIPRLKNVNCWGGGGGGGGWEEELNSSY